MAERDQDRLYNLLPAIHRIRDAENGYALRVHRLAPLIYPRPQVGQAGCTRRTEAETHFLARGDDFRLACQGLFGRFLDRVQVR
jgi:hypothetical protein